MRFESRSSLESDDKIPKGALREHFGVLGLTSLYKYLLYSKKNYDLLFQLRTKSCAALSLHLNGVRFPCPICSAPDILSKDSFILSLEHIFNCPGMDETRTKDLATFCRRASETQARLAEASSEPDSHSKTKLIHKLNDTLDRCKLGPKLLWCNIPLALTYLRSFLDRAQALAAHSATDAALTQACGPNH